MPTHAERLAAASQPNEIEMVYSYLLARFVDAAREKDDGMHARVFAAIELFEELWPEDTARWKKRFPGKRQPE